MPKLPEHPIFSKPGEPFVVVSLMPGGGPERASLQQQFKTSRRPLHYIGVGNAVRLMGSRHSTHYSEELHQVTLVVNDGTGFSEQLSKVMNGRLADQIHVHLVSGYPFKRRAQLLKRLGEHLKPGGRIFHAIQRGSFLVPHETPFASLDRWRWARLAHKSGLVLETFSDRDDANWFIQPKVKRDGREGSTTRQAAQKRTNRFHTIAGRLSDYWDMFGTHFLVFRKPAKPPSARKA